MDEGIGVLIVVVACIALAVFVAWIVLATLLRIFAWVLVCWVASFGIGVLVGVVVGVILPVRVLRGSGTVVPEVASPAAVTDGKVLGAAPRGHAKHFGWDSAWPLYLPYQARRDAIAVFGETRLIAEQVFRRTFRLLPDRLNDAWWVPIFGPGYGGFAGGLWLTVLAWGAVMAVVGGVAWLLQQATLLVYRWQDQLVRRRRRAVLRCSRCYRISMMPSYRCSNHLCSVIHRDVAPGPLGIIHRRCSCGTRLRTTVLAAATHLEPLCPYCNVVLPPGSGSRQVVPVPVIGSVGAGKTQLLVAGLVALEDRISATSGRLEPISPVAEEFVSTARAVAARQQRVAKTRHLDRPEGVPVLLASGNREVELHFMDAAGESFIDWERSRELSYLDTSEALVLVLDPFALPEVDEARRVVGLETNVIVADGDPEDAYASVIDRLRAEAVAVDKRSLAVVVTKVDVAALLPGGAALCTADPDAIRSWLRQNGADGLVRRIDRDFRNVTYFSVDSVSQIDPESPLSPVRVIDWALRLSDSKIELLRPPVATAAAARVPTG